MRQKNRLGDNSFPGLGCPECNTVPEEKSLSPRIPKSHILTVIKDIHNGITYEICQVCGQLKSEIEVAELV